MALTKSDCLDTFLSAWAALEDIVVSQKSSDEQVQKAENAQDQLTHDFIRERLDSLTERTAVFTQFVQFLSDVVQAIGNQGPLGAIRRLKGILDQASSALQTATANT